MWPINPFSVYPFKPTVSSQQGGQEGPHIAPPTSAPSTSRSSVVESSSLELKKAKEEEGFYGLYEDFPSPHRYQEINPRYREAGNIIEVFCDDFFDKLCPHQEQLEGKLPQENLCHLTRFIKTIGEIDKQYIERMVKFLEWNLSEDGKDSASSVVLPAIRKLIQESSLLRKKEFQISLSSTSDDFLGTLKTFFQEDHDSQQERTECIRVLSPNLSSNKVRNPEDLYKQVRTSLALAHQSEKKDFWVNFVYRHCVIYPKFSPFFDPASKTLNVLNAYKKAELFYIRKKSIPLPSHWRGIRCDSRRLSAEQGEKERERIAQHYIEDLQRVTQNREKVCKFLKYMLKEVEKDVNNDSNSAYEELFYVFNHIDESFIIDRGKKRLSSIIEDLRLNGYNITFLKHTTEMPDTHLYFTSSVIAKKYFLKALLDDEEAMKNLWKKENRLPAKEQGQSFHYKFIEYAIEKNGVSLFRGEDLLPITILDNQYAIMLCVRIFRELVRNGKLNVSRTVDEEMGEFFSKKIDSARLFGR